MDRVIVTTSSGLADAVRDVNAEVINFVGGCSDRQWAYKTAEEGWTLSMAGMHIAMANLAIATLVHRTASALDITDILEGFGKSNALDSRYHSDMRQSAVVERLQIYGAALERIVRDLSVEQINTLGSLRGRPITTAEVVETVAVGHARDHLDHMASTCGQAIT
jgi:Mycothiol maleylpyruvate isomerase N-terminal domain